MKRWLFFLLLVTYSTSSLPQLNLKRDTAYIGPRLFNNNALNELKRKKEFQYNTSTEPVQSLWDKFWSWVWWRIDQLLGTKGGRVTVWSVLIILSIAVIVFFVVKVTGMNKNSLFGRGNKGFQKYTLRENDIHHISFDDAIQKAVNDGDYRLATRLLYLRALKKLSDKGYIEWRINKTNRDYITELAGKPFNDIFSRLTFDFEYTWYGEQQVGKQQFEETREQFQQFNNQVS